MCSRRVRAERITERYGLENRAGEEMMRDDGVSRLDVADVWVGVWV